MIILTERGTVVHDTPHYDAVSIEQVKAQGKVYKYCGDDILYRFDFATGLTIYKLTKPKFHVVHLSNEDLEAFKRQKRISTSDAVVRDIGCELACVYLDDYSFTVPTSLLYK